MNLLDRRTLLALLTATLLPAAHAQAPAWPAKPLRIVAPFAPGGVTDIVARSVAASMSQGLGQPVVVENKPGAQGLLGSASVKGAPADGHTLLLMSSSVACVNPYLRKTMPFEVLKDFQAVGMIGAAPLIMVVSPSLPVNRLDQFIAHVKANPGKVSFSSPGVGGSAHLYGGFMNKSSQLDMQHLPYQGGVPALQAVLAGDMTMTFADLGSATGQVAAGKLKALAVSGDKRWPRFPEVPTFAEAGYPLNLVGWVGLMVPAGTPRAAIERLNAELRRFAESPANRDPLLTAGVMVASGTPEDMTTAIRDGCPPWGDAVRSAGIQPE